MFKHKRMMVLILLALVLWAGGALSEGPYQATVTLSDKTVTYSGSEVTIGNATVEGQNGQPAPTGGVTYAYYTDSACTQSFSGTPKNAGTYYAKAFLASDGVYAAAESNVATLTINKKLLNNFGYASLGNITKVYDGTTSYSRVVAPDVNGAMYGIVDGERLYLYNDIIGSVEFETANVGRQSMWVIATLLDSEQARNYTFPNGNQHRVQTQPVHEILPATPTISLPGRTTGYTGTAEGIGSAVVRGINDSDMPTGAVTFSYYSDEACTNELPGAPVNVGTYYAKATIEKHGNYTAAESNAAALVITPAVPYLELAGKTATYSGSAVTVSPAFVQGVSDADVPTGAVTYAYYSDEACTNELPGAPVNVGTYYAKAFIAADGNYTAAQSNTATIVITPATPTLTLADKTATYSGAAVTIPPATVQGVSDTDVPTGEVTYVYYSDEGCTDALSSAPKNAGTYYAKAFITADGNYTAAMSNTATLTIEKKILTGFGFSIAPWGKVYDGNTSYDGLLNVNPIGLIAGEYLEYGTDVLGVAEYQSPVAGAHLVWITAILQDTPKARNYTFEGGNQLRQKTSSAVLIYPAAPAISLAGKTVTYTGAAQGMDPAVVRGINDTDVPIGAVTYAYYTDEACANKLPGAPQNAGTYYAKAFIAARGNYTAAESSAAALVITPAAPTLTLADKTAKYSGSPVTISPAAAQGVSDTDVPTGAVTYAYYADEACASELPSAPKDAGTYYAKAFITAHGNYTAAESNTASLTILPAEPEIIFENITFIYDGAEHGIVPPPPRGVSETDVPTGALTYAFFTDSGCTQPLSGMPRSAGTYYVKISLAADNNYTAKSKVTTFTILPAEPSILFESKTVIYDGLDHDMEPPAVQGVSETDVPTGSLAYAYFTDRECTQPLSGMPRSAGIYYAKASLAADNNYTAASTVATLTIEPAVPTLTLESKTATYSGSAVTISPAALQGISDADVPTGAVTYAYYTDEACTNALPGAPQNAGTYYAKAFIAAHGNYTAAQSGAATVVITPATPVITLTDRWAVYTGNAIAIPPATVQGISPEDVPQGEITYAYFTDRNLQKAVGMPKTPGVYYAVATIAASGNYAGAASEPAVLTITKPDRPLQQVVTPTGNTITLLNDADTALHMNWQSYSRLVLDQMEEPAFFIASISALEDNTLALQLTLNPDSDQDGTILLDTAGQPVYGLRTLNLSAGFIKRLLDQGIQVLNAAYGQASVSIRLEDLLSLPGYETADAIRIVIEPGAADAPEEEAGVLTARDASGTLYRVSVLAVADGGQQETALQLPEGALALEIAE